VFLWPHGVVVDAAGKIYVTDTINWIVRFDNMTGEGWTTFGGFGKGEGQFLAPMGIFVR
jgi:DNA-binding beta-propeller fold protein YncE